jgi:hypothetical protein
MEFQSALQGEAIAELFGRLMGAMVVSLASFEFGAILGRNGGLGAGIFRKQKLLGQFIAAERANCF